MTGKDWAELLKFPLTILVGIFAIVIGSKLLNVRPTEMSIGDLKVKLETEIKQDITNSNIKMEATIRDHVKAELKNFNLDSLAPGGIDALPKDTASDSASELARVKTDGGTGTIFKSTVGYIWIGNYNTTTKKFSSVLTEADDLNKIDVGQQHHVKGNMVIRKNSPVQNVNYYKGEKNIGLVVRGTAVKILDKPEVKKLSQYDQYWVKIEVLE